MTARFHLSAATAPPTAPTPLPGFITDIRPRQRLREPRQATRAAQLTGLDGVYVPFAADGLESLVVAGGLLRGSSTVQVTAEFHPAIASPVYAAKLAASLQRYSASRLGWRLRIDLDQATARAHGDFLPEQDRYPRAAEFLTVAKSVWSTASYSYEGRFYQVLGGGSAVQVQPAVPRRLPFRHLAGGARAFRRARRRASVHPGRRPAAPP